MDFGLALVGFFASISNPIFFAAIQFVRSKHWRFVQPIEKGECIIKIRDRIVELRRVPARELRPNPKNWRSHPAAQQDALKGLLAELGYCDAVIARPLPDGSLQLIDGHLRCE